LEVSEPVAVSSVETVVEPAPVTKETISSEPAPEEQVTPSIPIQVEAVHPPVEAPSEPVPSESLPAPVTKPSTPLPHTRPAVRGASARYKTDQAVVLPSSFGGIEKIGMQFGSLSLGGDSGDDVVDISP
jgi:hypothetical protein